MSDAPQRPRKSKATKNTFVTKSGKSIKVNRSLSERVKAGREAKAQRKAAYLSTLPKEPWKRILYRLHPKRLYKYWFSRDGAIMALKITGVGFAVMFLLVVGLFAYFRKDLPKINDLNSGDSGGSIAFYDRNGGLLFQDYDSFKRIPVEKLEDISPYMRHATIAIEDKDFYKEGAFNVKGITRAAINNAQGKSTQGGSTITQQLVKLLVENYAKQHNVSRKVKELILAVELEREYSKDEILTAYLNIAPYSGLDAGVQAAAQDIFHTNAKDLTLAQASMLAAIPKEPGTLSPFASPRFNQYMTVEEFNQPALIGRQHYILDLMAKQGYIKKTEADAAKKVDVIAQVQQRPANHYAGIKSPYFVMAARKELEKSFPAAVIKSGGWKVTTTLDPNLQSIAEKAVNDNLSLLHRANADTAAFVAEDNQTGQVVAVVGGTDFENRQLSFATDAPISPGSSVKPYSYATFINNNNNVGAGSMLGDTQGPVPGYPCTNKSKPAANSQGNCLWDDLRSYNGNVTLRYALGSSLNVPAVKAFTSTDPTDTSTPSSGNGWKTQSINKTMSTINSLMGGKNLYRCYDPVKLTQSGRSLTQATSADETQCGAAAGIGNEAYTTLSDHVNGIASLSRLGATIPQTYILKVTNASGKVLKQYKQPQAKQILKQESAYIVNDMASDPGASYLGGRCTATSCYGMKFHRYKGWQNAIKTGTNEDLDGLMMSWNTKYTAGVWIGNYDRSAYGGTPENVTDPIMKAFMQGAIDSLGDVQPVNWTKPDGIKTLAAFKSAVPFRSQSPAPNEDLFPSWYVGNAKSTNTNTPATDKVSGLLATSCTPALAKVVAANAGIGSPLNVDPYLGGHPNVGNSTPTNTPTQNSYDNVHSCSDSAPTVTITAVNGTSASSATPSTCPLAGCNILVHVEAGTHPLSDTDRADYPGTLNLVVNGQVVQSQKVDDSGDYTLTYTPATGSSGNIDIQAQITDSVLYQGTDTKTVTIKSTTALKAPSTSGGAGNGGPGGVGTSPTPNNSPKTSVATRKLLPSVH